ncbi:MAG: AzlC family ABC transporter permease [Erysipelotrichaceae bacterium]|nr:AzlC family ABC transporter permease [Erysipelotrichaceae bacterium]
MNPFSERLRGHTFRKTSPVLTGYFFLGIGFGILLKQIGYGLFECLLMSVLIFSGSMQYAAIGLLSAHVSLASAFLTTLMVNARYLFYALSLVDRYRTVDKKKKPYLIHAIVDEAYALIFENDSPVGVLNEDYWLAVSLYGHLYWIFSTLLGVVIGTLFSFQIKGIDFVMTALFVTIFTDQWMKNKDHLPALIGLAVPAAFLFLLGRDRFLVPAMLVLSLFCAFYKGREEK